jgi:N-acetyl-gamma-glutamyl-phosphate reductase
MIKTGIVGGAGYVGGELIRILLHHPNVSLDFVQSSSHAGKNLSVAHPDLAGEENLVFSSEFNSDVDVIFLALGHGESKKFLDKHTLPEHIHLIDTSQDYRINCEAQGFVYGLSESNHTKIQSAQHIANPGCFATAILLALIPLAEKNLLSNQVHVSAITGSTGAGQKHSDTSHFSWRYSNISVYKAFEHQHMDEINHLLGQLNKAEIPGIQFLPFRGNFTRGILSANYLKCTKSLSEIEDIYNNYFESSPFVFVTKTNPDIKQVVNTNKCLLYLEKHDDTLLIISVIDNLIKGAAGQAIQNMNLMFGLDETSGLQLKASIF